MTQYDIVFLGGGLGTSMVSRYLKLKNPSLKILVLERSTKAQWSPGESTVGVAGLFLIRDLGLSTYAYLNHLPKNGLRFFFTKADANFDITKCSEIGSNKLPLFPTFQIDRKRIVEDLWKMNEQLGIQIKLGCTINALALSEQSGQLHRVEFSHNNENYSVETKWLINGSGRSSQFAPVFNELSEAKEDAEHCTAAGWGRFTNVEDMDLLGDEEWRRKVGYTSRYLSTTHIMGEGFWIWHIPIARGVVSFGVVYDKKVLKEDLTKNENFNAFLKRHPITAALLKNAKQEDFQSHPHLAYKRKTYCSKNRWTFAGESYMFVDPFYSPGSDVISREAKLIEHLVNSSERELPQTVELVNKFMDLEYETLKLLYVNQYQGFGSYESYNIKSFWDFYGYTNRIVWPFFAKYHENKEWLAQQVDEGFAALELMKSIQNGFRDLTTFRKERGELEHLNLSKYNSRQNYFRSEEDMVAGRYTDLQSGKNHFELCRISICELLEARFGFSGLVDKKVAQEVLNPIVMTSFRLTEEWFEGFKKRVALKLGQAVKSQLGKSLEVQLSNQCFAKELPDCFLLQDAATQDLVRKFWNEPLEKFVF